MAERRSNYTGAAHEDFIRRSMEEKVENKPIMVTPMTVLNEVARISCGLVEAGAPTQFMQNSSRLILRVLAHHGGICQLDLAKETHLKPPTISVALAKMEQEGLVTRTVDGMDGRATRVYLTDKGMSINEQSRQRIIEVENAAIAGLNEEECKALLDTLLKIRANLQAKAEKMG